MVPTAPVHNPIGVTIGSTVFAGLTLVANRHADRPRCICSKRPHHSTVRTTTCIQPVSLRIYGFHFTSISILFRAEVRALLCLSVLCCTAICFMLVLANKINNNKKTCCRMTKSCSTISHWKKRTMPTRTIVHRCKREAQLSPSDRAMRLVASNLLVFLINWPQCMHFSILSFCSFHVHESWYNVNITRSSAIAEWPREWGSGGGL